MTCPTLTAVVLDGQFRVAQYGHWDSENHRGAYDVLEFLQHLQIDNTRQRFDALLRTCSFYTPEELQVRSQQLSSLGCTSWYIENHHPELSRATVARILLELLMHLLVETPACGLKLNNYLQWKDGRPGECSDLWVIDLDTNVWEIYMGNGEEPEAPGSRFAFTHPNWVTPEAHWWKPSYVKPMPGQFSLTDLPSKDQLRAFYETHDPRD
jgi:rubredoxin